MKLSALIGILISLFLAGCSSVVIVPSPETPGAIVNPADRSIRIDNSGLSVAARIQDTAVGGYEIQTAIAGFYLVIRNQASSPVNIALDQFTLIDSRGTSLSPIPPKEVNAILNPEISYFMPYPFVGYYDVIQLEQYRASSAMASEAPYAGTGLSGVDRLIPIKTGQLGTGQSVSGMIYFPIEIINESRVVLRFSPGLSPVGKQQLFSFPFAIKK